MAWTSAQNRAACARWRAKNPTYFEEWTALNPDKVRKRNRTYRRKVRFGITAQRYKEMLAGQEMVCAICKKPESMKTLDGEIREFCIDHNHTTGKVRALLCSRCNRTIGLLNEDTTILQNMIMYLEKHRGS